MGAAVSPPVTERSAVGLARAIRAGEVSAAEVVGAHVSRVRARNPQLNAIVVDRLDEALAEAQEADRRIAAAAPDDPLPPLLGVPVTIKESIAVAGLPNTAGFVPRQGRTADRTAPAAQRLLDAGAILLGLTNTSELCMWIESDNRVYGRTNNAHDPARIAGGSSGGEGAAVGAGLAPIGLGSDIGGSIRLPAFFNGVFGHKASPGTVPNTGQFPVTHGDAARMLTIGPLARRAEDLMPVLRIIAGPDGEDERCVERALGDPADVRIADLEVIVTDDASLLPLRGDLRHARDRAAEALGDAGARLRTESLKSLRRALELYLAALQDGAGVSITELAAEHLGPRARGPRAWLDALRGDGPHTLPTMLLMATEPWAARMPDRRTRRVIATGRSVTEEAVALLDGAVWLHPPFARPAPRHHRTVGRPWVITSAALFNLLGLPATQVPTGLNADGVPLGVQVAAAPDGDDRTIAVALELERRLGGWVPPVPAG